MTTSLSGEEMVNAGGAAFSSYPLGSGLTIRDYFAAAALQGYLAAEGPPPTLEQAADRAYGYADAMLKKRQAP